MKTLPPKEPLVNFVEGVWRFEKSFKVEYSNFLELIYGYKSPEAYRIEWQYKVSSYNRVFKRCVKGDKMTDNNKGVISEVVKIFPQWDKYVQLAKKAGAFQKPEEDNDE